MVVSDRDLNNLMCSKNLKKKKTLKIMKNRLEKYHFENRN